VIAVRLWGREIFAAGRCDCEKDDDGTRAVDVTGGQFDLAEPFVNPEETVYLRSRRQRPDVVAIGSRHRAGTRSASLPFGFQRECSSA
jgi:hypothetical protein